MIEISALIVLSFLISSQPDNLRMRDVGEIPPFSGVVQHEYDSAHHLAGPFRDRVGRNLMISDDEEHHHQNETCVFINPADPNHILGGCNDYRGGDAICGWYVSFDGGRNWEDGIIETLVEFERAGDPSVVINHEGTAWFSGIHYTRGTDDGGIFCCRSNDGGRSWGEPVWVVVHRDQFNAPFEDKPYMTIDNSGSDYDGNLYISWVRFGTGQIYFSRSDDEGVNWSDPQRIYAGRGHGPLPVVGVDGELYVIWKDYSQDRIVGMKSDDGGGEFGDMFVIAGSVRLPDELPPTEFRTNSIPSACVDQSASETRGRVYVAWADYRTEDADILLSWSDDAADNWSDPTRLNDDPPENGIDQFFPWIAADPSDGTLYAVWYDRRLDEDNILMDLFGLRWDGLGEIPDNERISNESCDPRIGFEGGFIGDYNGIAAANGQAHPAWCDTRSGNQDIYYALFDGNSHFTPVEGEREHRIILESITINGEPPSISDEAAVLDGENNIIGSISLEGEPPWDLTATGDWAVTHNHSYMHWLVWDNSEALEIAAFPEITEGDIFFRDEGETTLSLISPPPDRQVISLYGGWNIISSHIIPVNLDPYALFRMAEENVVKVSDEDGRFISYRWQFSNMPPHDPLSGYVIGVAEDCEIVMEGVQVDPQYPVPLDPGWNLASYLPEYELDPWIAFDGIIDALHIAKDEYGRFLVPGWHFSNMLPLAPGEGYKIKIENELPVDLIYPEEGGEIAGVISVRPTEHYVYVPQTNQNMSLLILELDGLQNSRHDGELAVQNQSGEILGAAVIEGPAPYGLTAWYAIENMSDNPGKLVFQYWDRHTGRDYALIPKVLEGSLNYEIDGLAVIELEINSDAQEQNRSEAHWIKVSPNPCNSMSLVQFKTDISGHLDLKLYTLRGELVQSLHTGFIQAGEYSFTLDAKRLASGIYLLGYAVGGNIKYQRMVILK